MADTSKSGGQMMSAAQRAYEAKRAAKAGKSLDAWLADKQKRQVDVQPAATKAAAKKAGFFSRLLDRAHKPL